MGGGVDRVVAKYITFDDKKNEQITFDDERWWERVGVMVVRGDDELKL